MACGERIVEGRGGVGQWTGDRGFRNRGVHVVVGVGVADVSVVGQGRGRGSEDFVLGSEFFEFALQSLVVG